MSRSLQISFGRIFRVDTRLEMKEASFVTLVATSLGEGFGYVQGGSLFLQIGGHDWHRIENLKSRDASRDTLTLESSTSR